jgi:hypothetical protein
MPQARLACVRLIPLVSTPALHCRESERLLGDPAAQAGEAALAQGVSYRYGVARGIHKASSSIASGLMVRDMPRTALGAPQPCWLGHFPGPTVSVGSRGRVGCVCKIDICTQGAAQAPLQASGSLRDSPGDKK